uniref:Uncharacterized protein n=1 Tax=Oryza meridionalis TaxID=40149 RepID=A0A0E0DNJ0_9ORYZ
MPTRTGAASATPPTTSSASTETTADVAPSFHGPARHQCRRPHHHLRLPEPARHHRIVTPRAAHDSPPLPPPPKQSTSPPRSGPSPRRDGRRPPRGRLLPTADLSHAALGLSANRASSQGRLLPSGAARQLRLDSARRRRVALGTLPRWDDRCPAAAQPWRRTARRRGSRHHAGLADAQP